MLYDHTFTSKYDTTQKSNIYIACFINANSYLYYCEFDRNCDNFSKPLASQDSHDFQVIKEVWEPYIGRGRKIIKNIFPSRFARRCSQYYWIVGLCYHNLSLTQ